MELTKKQKKVLNKALEGNNLFITGSGGVGKSFLLKVLVDELRKKYSDKEIAVTALTGLAAVPIGGKTLHSFAGMGHDLSREPNRFTLLKWMRTKVLIVDEVSMLTKKFLDKIYPLIKRYHIQVIFFGDFYQLPPVQGDPCFLSDAWKELGLLKGTQELTQVIRQTDKKFIKVLNEVRVGNLTDETIDFLRKLEITKKKPDLNNVTKLYALNRDVEAENLQKLDKIDNPLVILEAKDGITAKKNHKILKQMINKEAPQEIYIKVGALVMLTRNIKDTPLVNGSIGTVEDFSADGTPLIRFKEYSEPVRISRIEYEVKLGKEKIIRSQYPLKLAWAITIHKGQGMSLDNVLASVKGSFERGQIYTVLSRARTPEGLYIDDVDYIINRNKVCDMAKKYYSS